MVMSKNLTTRVAQFQPDTLQKALCETQNPKGHNRIRPVYVRCHDSLYHRPMKPLFTCRLSASADR